MPELRCPKCGHAVSRERYCDRCMLLLMRRRKRDSDFGPPPPPPPTPPRELKFSLNVLTSFARITSCRQRWRSDR